MVHTIGEPSEKEFESAKEIAKDGKMKVVKMQLEITSEQARDIQKQAQHQRIKERQKQSLLALSRCALPCRRGRRLSAPGGSDEGILTRDCCGSRPSSFFS